MKKYKNKYRIESTRLQSWDYGSSAFYFITICTHNRHHFFGNVDDGQMQLSEIGIIAKTEWEKTFEIRKDMNLIKGEFVVMPDHFHAVIGIGKNQFNCDAMHVVSGGAMHRVPTNKFGPQSKNLASIIRGFKSAVTISARRINSNFKWQSLYHDHIIRDQESLRRISNYIIDNPAKWLGRDAKNRDPT